MRAYVIKREDGRFAGARYKPHLNEAYIYPIRIEAENGCCEGDIVVPIEIKIIKTKRKKKGKSNEH